MTEYIMPPPEGYVQAAETLTYSDTLPKGVECVQIAREDFPSSVAALNLIRADTGGPMWLHTDAPWIPKRWLPYLPRIEAVLNSLNHSSPAKEDTEEPEYASSEFNSFVMGECIVMEAMQQRSPDHYCAGSFLTDFFDGWNYYGDDGFDPYKPTTGPVNIDSKED